MFAKGVLEILPENYGFLRTAGYLPSREDVYVSQTQIRRFDMQNGDYVTGQVRPPKEGEKYYSLLKIEAINGVNPEEARQRVPFDNLTPIFPNVRYTLEYPGCPMASRLIDLVSPIGMGQRAMIVSPPKAGKTTVLKNIANSITTNFPEAVIKVLLVDERPEEVTDMQRSVKGEVVASTFDEPPEDHIRIAELTARIDAKGSWKPARMSSSCSIRSPVWPALTTWSPRPPDERSPAVLTRPVCTARKILRRGAQHRGRRQLTIIATALVETGSRMDDIIYEEFKGTGNMELHLEPEAGRPEGLPAIDVRLSGTRREELLMEDKDLKKMWLLRKVMDSYETVDATEQLIERMKTFKTNKAFMESADAK